MEGCHKLGRQGQFKFSGGKTRPTEKREYQERALELQFVNAWFRADKKDRLGNAKLDQASSVKKQLLFQETNLQTRDLEENVVYLC